ncbi:hypothetical protein N7509_003138 [Penicillium cosmopolitanum]|uniref:Uncharacterized protein n=1 Tax=Penicillium cosmopolitanum TaxID=1131564 RepID=A0A9W9W4L9_9EURO|nr:uncharacterized protein N7509_003138 [Penicillium cosmopolitanum]KAJ5403267.1 hypothetical protein N7509_003138 [Penicillium cosmopolitanum]
MSKFPVSIGNTSTLVTNQGPWISWILVLNLPLGHDRGGVIRRSPPICEPAAPGDQTRFPVLRSGRGSLCMTSASTMIGPDRSSLPPPGSGAEGEIRALAV